MITYKIKVILIFWIVERFFCKPWRDAVSLHRLSIADGIGKANAGRLSRSQRTQARSVLKSRRWSCARHRDASWRERLAGRLIFTARCLKIEVSLPESRWLLRQRRTELDELYQLNRLKQLLHRVCDDFIGIPNLSPVKGTVKLEKPNGVTGGSRGNQTVIVL